MHGDRLDQLYDFWILGPWERIRPAAENPGRLYVDLLQAIVLTGVEVRRLREALQIGPPPGDRAPTETPAGGGR